jgi:diguanylate cyclase (GGDEF)-like protein
VQPATLMCTNMGERVLLMTQDRHGRSRHGSELRIYALLTRLPRPKSYLGKIMLSAFLGTHVPLIVLVLYLVFAASIDLGDAVPILVIVLFATLLGTLATLYTLYCLLSPGALASKALRDYLDMGRMPSLPTSFTDQAGRLMADVQYVLERLDEVIRSLEEASTKDHLTGVYNRRAGEQRLGSDLGRVARGQGTLTVAVIDLDRFKPINDRYGHQAGDAYLQHFAHTCMRNIRKGDWLARWGGDEFVLALWEDKGEPMTAKAVLDRIARNLDENPVWLGQGDMINLTFSAGVYRCRDSEDAEQGVSGILALADEALYEAKEEAEENTFVFAR